MIDPGTPAKAPFIIWTLQRTGGTNLAQRLVARSGLKGVEHEPFNPTRAFGHITRHWLENKDRRELAAAVGEIVKNRVIIKHCVENVPWEITETLAAAAANAGYRHLFLYRRSAVSRLLSLHFAKVTGVWGARLKDRLRPSAAIFSKPLPVADLVKHERHSVRQLTRTWGFLLAQNALQVAIAYEDIFQSREPERPLREIQCVLAALGLSRGTASDRTFLSEMLAGGDQGTRDKYADFPGIDGLKRALEAVPSFNPTLPEYQLKIVRLFENVPWVRHAAIDTQAARLDPGRRFNIGGVVVLSDVAPAGCALRLNGAAAAALTWGIRSPWMEKQFSSSPNCGNARFRVEGLFPAPKDFYEIVLDDVQGTRVPLFRFTIVQGSQT